MYIYKRQENCENVNPISEHRLVSSQLGRAINLVDRLRTSANERDVVWAPRCRDCEMGCCRVWSFFIDLSFLREQSP